MTYQIIALDLDGTLLTQQKQILPESLTVLAKAKQQGIKVIIVTGRHHVSIKPFYHALELDTPALCCNGTYSYNFQTEQIIEGNALRKDQALQLLNLIRQQQLHCLLYVQDAMIYEQPDETTERWHKWSMQLPEKFRPNIYQVTSYEEAIENSDAIWKFVTLAPEPELLNFSQVINDNMGLACDISWHNQMDITQQGNSKGNLLKKWAESQGINMQHVIAFGDNFNDLSMLKMAGMGIAMGNSSDDIKAIADLVTTDNNSTAIADIISQYVIK